MKIPTLVFHPLAFALAAALATSPPASAKDAPAAIVAFGDQPSSLSRDDAPSGSSGSPILRPSDVDHLEPEVSRHFLAMVDATSLPLEAREAATLARMVEQGTPVLVRMNTQAPEDLARVSALFGIAPTTGEVILRNDRGRVDVFASSPDGAADTSALLHALAGSDASVASAAEADVPDKSALLPARHFDVNFVDAQGEVSGVTGIDVVRSRTVSADHKLLTVTSKVAVKTANNGVSDGSKTGRNEWTADLPFEYRLRHAVKAGGAEVTYLDHFPLTDGRTDFTQTDTENRGFTIGGSTGSEISASGKPDENLAAKVPFNLSFAYEHKWQSSLSTTFQDYSILATPQNTSGVTWTALLAPKLHNILVKRWGAGMPQLTEDRMTPMMRVASFEALSQWKIPGAYEGMATVTVSAGYRLERKKWWWARTDIKHSNNTATRDLAMDFVIDMADPYLSAEITVLIRSATGSGACLRDNNGIVGLAACRATDRQQMWGLDAASRYVNRGSGRCLTAQPTAGSVVTESCQNITYEKQWQWRADRLHSMIDHGRYRLYVEGEQVHYAAPVGRFPDFPTNPYASALEPWTNYPAAPRPHIDHIMGPAGSRTLEVGEEYAQFPAVTDEQRWHVEVLRQGL